MTDTSTIAAEHATTLTIAWLRNPNTRMPADQIPAFLTKLFATIEGLMTGDMASSPPPVSYTPAVGVRKSLASRDHIISMIDGKPYRTLKRHLSQHGLTGVQYRARYGLKADYPLVAPGFSEARSAHAKRLGLGGRTGKTKS